MAKTIVMPDAREGFSMKVDGVRLNRPDLHEIALELGIGTRDVLVENEILTVYNTSQACQEIIEDNALVAFVAMALNISAESISEVTAVKAKPKIIEMDDMLDEDED